MIEKAQWITAADCAGRTNCAFRCWRKFSLTKVPDQAKLHITASSNYMAYLNGKLVGRGPARGSHGVFYFDTLEVASALHEGENILAVSVHSQGRDNFLFAPVSVPALRLELVGVLQSDASFQGLRSLDYVTHEDVYTHIIGIAERRDLSLAPSDAWMVGKDQAAQWPPMELAREPLLEQRALEARPVPLLKECWIAPSSQVIQAELKACQRTPGELAGHWIDGWSRNKVTTRALDAGHPLRLSLPTEGDAMSLVYDFQQDHIGFPEVVINNAAGGEEVFLSYSEHLVENRVPTRYANPVFVFTDSYRLAPGKNTIGSQFIERGGRFLQIVVAEMRQPLAIEDVRFLEHRYPVCKRGTFNSSDPVLNRLWQMAQENLSLCMTDVFTDCPWREHAFWTNDIVVEICTSVQMFGAEAIHRHAFTMLKTEQHDDGWIPGVIPDPGAFPMRFVIPAANLSLFRVLKDYYMYSDDQQTVADVLPVLERVLEAAETTCDETGLVRAPEKSWDFYDWAHELHDICFTGHRESMFNFLYVTAIRNFLFLAQAVGYRVNAPKWQACSERVAQAVWREFPIQDGLLYDECSYYETQNQPEGALHEPVATQLAHAMALESGAVPQSLQETFIHALNDERALSPDYYMSFYVLREMQHAGLHQDALNRIRRDWGRAVASGEATIPEMGITQFGKEALWGSGSLCHGFSTGPIDFLQTALLGIRPIKPGFAEFAVDIHPCDLLFAEGKVPTPHGDIEISWRREGNGLAVILTVPEKCTARVNDQQLHEGTYELNL